MDSLVWPWVTEIAFISYRDVTQNKPARPPLPSEFLATFVVFGGLTLVAQANTRVASLMGWGFVIATALNVFNPQAQNRKTLLNPAGVTNTGKTETL